MNTPTLKPCEECQGTGETIIEKHNCDCPDCLGTGYEEPAKRIMNLERELVEARKQLEDFEVEATNAINDIVRVKYQRDTLVEAMTEYMNLHIQHGFVTTVETIKAWQTLVAVKGGEA